MGNNRRIKVEGKQALLFFHFFFEMAKYAITLNTAVNIPMFFRSLNATVEVPKHGIDV